MKRLIVLAAFAAFLTVTFAPVSSPEAKCFLGIGKHCHHHHHHHHHHNHSVLGALKHAGHAISKGAKHAAKETAKGVTHAAKATGKWTTQAAKDTGEWVSTAARDFSKSPACAPMARCIARKAMGPMQKIHMCGSGEPLCNATYKEAKAVQKLVERQACAVAGVLMGSVRGAAAAGMESIMHVSQCIRYMKDPTATPTPQEESMLQNNSAHAACHSYKWLQDQMVDRMCAKK